MTERHCDQQSNNLFTKQWYKLVIYIIWYVYSPNNYSWWDDNNHLIMTSNRKVIMGFKFKSYHGQLFFIS